MQSCPKNALTGTGPTKKGPVSANSTTAIAENAIPKTPSGACKIENILAPSVTIKPENRDQLETTKAHELYKVLDSPELAPSPARGSTGLTLPPPLQHEAVQPSESSLKHSSSDSVSLSQRKPRVGKSMERERQQQQHITMSGYQTTLGSAADVVVSEFKQEFVVKGENDVKKEKDCDETATEYRLENIKVERSDDKQDSIEAIVRAPEPELTVMVNLMSESGDECIDYSMKRKLNDSSSSEADVIELSDSNSTLDPPSSSNSALSILKRRKLLEKPATTPKKSPPNSYKSLIKQSTAALGTYPTPTSKSKLITSSINRGGGKTCIKRRTMLKSKSLKKLRMAVKAKKRTTKKKAQPTGDAAEEAQAVLDMAKETTESSSEEKSSEDVSTEHNEEKSMDGSSECSGKSNIDLTIDRVAKGYFSESDIFSCLSKQRKSTNAKKLKAKLMKAHSAKSKSSKKSGKKLKVFAPATSEKSKTKKAPKADKQENLADDDGEKAKKTKKKVNKKAEVEVELVEKDPLALDDDIPSSHSTPKRKPKPAAKKTKKVIETTTIVDSDEDDKVTVVTVETRDEETSTTVLSSAQTINTSKSTLLDETDVANNNNEFEDNNRQKQQDTLTLYKTPGYGWSTFSKSNGKRGKKAKFGKSKKHKITLLNDIVIPKSTSIPRWSNGWTWEGEPFQALVFLNVSPNPSFLCVTRLTELFATFRATIRQCRGHAMTRCVTRSAATSFDQAIVCS